MAISEIKSKKHGKTFQVDIKYKSVLGVSKRHIKSGFKSMKEAKKYERDFKEQLEILKEQETSIHRTFNDIYYEYIEIEGKVKYSNATKVYYNATHKMYVKNTIGNESIGSLKYMNLQQFFNRMSEKYNPPTLKNIKKLLAVTFKYALRNEYIRENPIPYIQIPKSQDERKVKVEIISDDDLSRIIDAIQNTKKTNPYSSKKDAEFTFKSYAMALIIGRYTGLRISETLALKKKDFDLEKCCMKVRRKVEYSGLKGKDIHTTHQLKSANSKGTVEISRKLCQYLKMWFEINPFEFVVCDGQGNFIKPETLNHRIREVCKELGIHFHYHMLRHTYATELVMSNVNPVVIKGLMRHGDISTTWSIYTHPQNEDQRKALDSLYMKMK
ncbi:site-specific integrase [Thomasclavelia cocleata]|jgi:integrase|uniref:site-specific integrase n=1 Tax=Thomasclavelia cocleata TaxID=69824 RepID=UPI00241F556C|nr:site-specific integrase [Thomasclavelia cocleata]